MTAAKTGASLMKKTTGRQQEHRARATRAVASGANGDANLARGCKRPKLNHLWSIWYCLMTIAFQIYIVTKSIQRFTRYISLPWPTSDQPYMELNAYVGLVGTAVVILPFFVASSLLRVGNYSNDGLKIGTDQDPDCGAKTPEAGVAGDPAAVYQNLSGARGTVRCLRWFKSIWRHGGPTAPVLHMAAAFCLLMPTVLIQAQLIRHGFLSKADIWKTDLDFFLSHRDRLVMLKFLSTVNTSEALQRDEVDRARPRLHLDPTSATERQYIADEFAPGLISAEFMNYAIALLVHAVRYPSVFWRTNKTFGLIFSVQLVMDAAQKIVTFAGFTVLYKIHVYGPHDVLLRHNPLLLNVPVTLILFLLYNLVLTFSGSVMYLYGLQKYREWRESTVKRTHVTWKEESRRLWGHVPHLGAFMIVLMVALTASPLMYDYTMVYCGSLDGAMLAGVTGTIMHLFLWILLWLALTVKHGWQFKRLGNYSGSGSSSTVNHIRGGSKNGKDTPLLVIDNGQTYQVREKTSKKAIVNLAQRSATASPVPATNKPISPASADDEDIYWLKPKPSLPKDNKDSPDSDRLAWLKTHKKSPGIRHKVSFEEKGSVASGNPCKRTRSSASTKSPKVTVKNKKGVKFEDLSDDNSEDGDYATLREMVVARDETDDEQIDQPIFAKTVDPKQHRRILSADGDYELLVDENYKMSAPVVVHSGGVPLRPMHKTGGQNILLGDGYEPLTVGTHSEGHLTPKSDSVSESSTSPEKGGGCGSESSSGVHSNSSVTGDPKRSSSMENLLQDLVQARPTPWKSMSLQRNTPAPMPLLNITTGTNTTPRSIKPDAIYFDPNDSTLVIRRKQKRDNGDGAPAPTAAIVPLTTSGVSDHFGRATNMRMTSFTDQPDFPNGNTLQPLSGGPLSGLGVLPGPGIPKHVPSLPSSPKTMNNDGNQNALGNYGTLSLNTQVKNFPALLGNGIYGTTKPMGAVGLMGQTTLLPMYPVHQRRDSANYSLTSSGDSDTYMSHS